MSREFTSPHCAPENPLTGLLPEGFFPGLRGALRDFFHAARKALGFGDAEPTGVEDTEEMSAEMGASAFASGDATRTDGAVLLGMEMVDGICGLGEMAVAVGQVSVAAAATATGDDAFADADAFADVSGADFIYTFTREYSGSGSRFGIDAAVDWDQVFVLAIDLPDVDFADGPLVYDVERTSEIGTMRTIGAAQTYVDQGHRAAAYAYAEAPSYSFSATDTFAGQGVSFLDSYAFAVA